MSTEIEKLQQELRVAHELLFLVLDQIGEPVVLDAVAAKEAFKDDRMIDIDLDDENGLWTLQVVTISSDE